MQRICAETRQEIHAPYFYENEEIGGSDWSRLSLLRGGERGDVVCDVRESIVCGEDALTVLELVQAMVQSGREHRMIKVE